LTAMKIEKLSSELSLANDGGLSVFFLGVGSAFAKKNFQTNLLVVKGNTHILIDCGTTCSAALVSYKSSIAKIKNLLITHSHADHIGSLEEAALMGRYATKIKPNIIITNDYQQILWENSLRGGLAYGEVHSDGYLTFDDYFTAIIPEPLANDARPLYQCKLDGIDIKIFRTKHIPDTAGTWKTSFYSIGVLIDERILFPSDTRFDPDLISWMLKTYPTIEYIFHDCQFYNGGVHASYEELKTLPQKIRSKIYLSHYGDNFATFTPEADGFLGFAQQGVYYHFDKK
jgi:ribonuclease BN (tRNA processing enzyme)